MSMIQRPDVDETVISDRSHIVGLGNQNRYLYLTLKEEYW